METTVAALFGLRCRALGAVVSLNLVTNPLLNLFFISLIGVGVGYTTVGAGFPGPQIDQVLTVPWVWVLLVVLEAAVVIAEWRGLIWTLGRQVATPRRLLSVSIVMNVVSATLGTFLLMRVV